MSKAKFKVNDWVHIVTPPINNKDEEKSVAHILEVREQLCEAGVIQIAYVIRVWSISRAGIFNTKEILIREMELGEKIHASSSLNKELDEIEKISD